MQLRIPFKNPFKNSNITSNIQLIVIILIFFLLGNFSAIYWGKTKFAAPATKPTPIKIQKVVNCEPNEKELKETVDFSLFWKVWAIVQQRHINRNTLDYQKMLDGAIRGMLSSLEDPYTVFLNAQEFQKFKEEISGQLEGIGIEIAIKDGVLTIIAPLEGTPAQRAGLKSKDQIIEINSALTKGMQLDEAVRLIRGPRGTKVTLSILREDWVEPKKFEIERAIINIPSVSLQKIDSDIVHLKIHNFYDPTRLEFTKKALGILLSGRKKIILDLRNNPGGYFDSAISIAGWFLSPNSIVVQQDTGSGLFVCDGCRSTGTGIFKNHQIVVLINNGTASAAEILAGALRDNLGVLLIGEQSFGKGSVQEIHQIENNSSVKITTAKWFTPNGATIDQIGLKPDIEEKNNPDTFNDAQLEKALEILRKG